MALSFLCEDRAGLHSLDVSLATVCWQSLAERTLALFCTPSPPTPPLLPAQGGTESISAKGSASCAHFDTDPSVRGSPQAVQRFSVLACNYKTLQELLLLQLDSTFVSTFTTVLMALAGRRVLVAGGSGTVGSGAVCALLREGAKVLVSSRSSSKFDELKQKVAANLRPNLSLIQADVSTEEGAKTIFDKATKDGNIQHVIASIGGFWMKGRLEDQSLNEFNERIKDAATGHFLLFRIFASYLDKVQGSTYTIISGNAGLKLIMPNTSLLSVGSGATNGISVAALAEYKDRQVGVNDLRIHCLVHPKPDDAQKNDEFNVGNDLIGDAIVAVVKGRVRGLVDVYNRKDAKALIK